MSNGRYAKWSSCQMVPDHSTRYTKWPDEFTEGQRTKIIRPIAQICRVDLRPGR